MQRYLLLLASAFCCAGIFYSFTGKKRTELLSFYRTDIIGCSYPVSLKFNELPPAKLMTGIGNSHLQITTTNKKAQQFFDQGLNHLHSFWDVEAYRAFKEVIRLDSNCAMGYWGLYNSISQVVPEMSADKKEAIRKAVEKSNNATAKEKMFIRAAELMSKEGKNAYIAEMEALIDAYPEEIEAKLFLAASLSAGVSTYAPDGRPRTGKVYGQMLLKNILVSNPNSSAANHYWIHAVENGPQPQLALESAAKIMQLAPNSGHMTHMPGHIYYRVGDYDKAYKTFTHSLGVDTQYMNAQKMGPTNHWNFTHNLDYLVATCAESGRYTEAVKWATKLAELPIEENRQMAGGLGYILFGAHTAMARLNIRFQYWDKATENITAQLNAYPVLPTLAKEYFNGMKFYTSGMSAIAKNDNTTAETNLAKLKDLLTSLSTKKAELGADWYFQYALKILRVNAKELEGLLFSNTGDFEKAVTTLKEAAIAEKEIGYWEPPHYSRPVYESLAQVYTKARKHNEAIEAYKQALKLRPKSKLIMNEINKLKRN